MLAYISLSIEVSNKKQTNKERNVGLGTAFYDRYNDH